VSSFSQDWLGYRAYNLAYYQITENSIHYLYYTNTRYNNAVRILDIFGKEISE
jgi:hypothetical protein